MLMTSVPSSGVIYITIYGHTLFIYIICHGNEAVCIEVRVAYNMKKNKNVDDRIVLFHCYIHNKFMDIPFA